MVGSSAESISQCLLLSTCDYQCRDRTFIAVSCWCQYTWQYSYLQKKSPDASLRLTIGAFQGYKGLIKVLVTSTVLLK